MRRYAVLIDAGFLKRKRGSRENPLTAEAVEDFVQELGGHPVLWDLQLHPPRGRLDARADEPAPGGFNYPAAPSGREMTISACAFSSGRTECPR